MAPLLDKLRACTLIACTLMACTLIARSAMTCFLLLFFFRYGQTRAQRSRPKCTGGAGSASPTSRRGLSRLCVWACAGGDSGACALSTAPRGPSAGATTTTWKWSGGRGDGGVERGGSGEWGPESGGQQRPATVQLPLPPCLFLFVFNCRPELSELRRRRTELGPSPRSTASPSAWTGLALSRAKWDPLPPQCAGVPALLLR
jgi:hypothetical protein